MPVVYFLCMLFAAQFGFAEEAAPTQPGKVIVTAARFQNRSGPKTPEQKCHDAICTERSDYSLSTLEDEVDFSEVQAPEILSMTEQAIQQEHENERTRFEAIEKWLPTAPTVTDPAMIRILNLMSARNAAIEFTNEGTLDRAKMARLNKWTTAEAKRNIDILSYIFFELPDTDWAFQEIDPKMLAKTMTTQQIQAKVDQVLTEIENNMGALTQLPQLQPIRLYYRDFSSTYLREQIRLKGLTTEIISFMNTALSESVVLKKSLSDPKLMALLSSPPINLQDHARKRGLLQIGRNNLRRLNTPTAIGEAKSACLHSLATAEVALPSAAQTKQLQQISARLKGDFSREIAKVAPLSAATLRSIGNISYFSQDTRENFRQRLTAAVTDVRDEAERRKSAQRAVNGVHENLYHALNLLGIRAQVPDAPDGLSNLPGAHYACLSRQVRLVPDQAELADVRIRLGIAAYRWPDKASAIGFHELGHHLQYIINERGNPAEKEWLAEVLICLKSLHPRTETIDYSDEDFADLLESLQPNFSNASCFLMGTKEPDVISLKNPDKRDNHSGELYRALLIDYHKTGALNPQCTEVMKGRPPVRNCLQAAVSTNPPKPSPQPAAK